MDLKESLKAMAVLMNVSRKFGIKINRAEQTKSNILLFYYKQEAKHNEQKGSLDKRHKNERETLGKRKSLVNGWVHTCQNSYNQCWSQNFFKKIQSKE